MGLQKHDSTAAGSNNASPTLDLEVKKEICADGGTVVPVESISAGKVDSYSPASEPRTYRRRYVGVLAILLISMIISWMWLSFAMVNEFAQELFGVGPQEINWFSVVYCFLAVWFYPGAWCTSRYGYKFTILIAAALTVAGSWVRFAGTWTHNYGVALLGQGLLASAGPFVMPLPTTYSSIWFTPKERTTATAAMTMAPSLGSMLGSLVTPFWATSPDALPRSILYVSIMATAIAGLCVFVPSQPPNLPEADMRERGTNQSAHLVWKHTLRMISSLEFWLLAVPFIVGLAFFNAWASLISLILSPYGFSLQMIGVIGSVQTGSGIATAVFLAPFIDRLNLHVIAFKVSMILMTGAYVALIFVPPTGSIAFAAAIMILAGVVGSSSQAVILELLAEVLYPVSPALTSGPCWGLGNILGGAALFAMTALQAGEDGDPPFNLQRALWLQAVFCGASFLPALFLGCCGRSRKVQYHRRIAQASMGIRESEV